MMSEYANPRAGRVEDAGTNLNVRAAAPGRHAGRVTAWTGWMWFAGVIMILIGAFNAIEGLIAVFQQEFYVVGQENVLVFDLTAWGLIHLIVGGLVAITGIALIADAAWARPVTVVLAVINAIVHLTFVTVYPVWSVIGIALCVVVIWAIVVHGDEASRLDW
jgi:hypothetical protein